MEREKILYGTNKPIQSLAEIKMEKQKQLELERDIEARKIMIIALDYYNINYPRSIKNLNYDKSKIRLEIGNKNIHDFLNERTEEELYGIYDIFDYYSAEKGFHIVKDFEKKKYILGLVNKLIPGGAYVEKMRRLKAEMRERQKELEAFEERLEKDRKEFQKKFLKVPEIPKEEEFEFICEVCGKGCKTGSGLASHMKTHE